MEATQSMEASLASGTAPSGINVLSERAHRAQKRFALAIMVLPALGMLEAVQLASRGALLGADYALFAAMYFVHMGGVTMGLHRMIAHRAFEARPWVRALLIIMGSTAGQGPLLYWVSTHRAHHAYSDGPRDPHSPHLYGTGLGARLRGLWHAHMPWMLSDKLASWAHFSRDVMKDRQLLWLHQTYVIWLLLGLALPAGMGVLIHGGSEGLWIGFVVGGLARMFLANQAAWCVGSLSHMFGGRPFRTGDQSANNWPVALFAFGEGLQNNHHAFPSSYRHAMAWWEPDLSAWCLLVMERFALVRNLKFPSREVVERQRHKQD